MPVVDKVIDLNPPTLDELCILLNGALSKNFQRSSVRIVDCPDLTRAPFLLASSGLCGNVRIADVGGVPNLHPMPKLDKIYQLRDIAELCGLPNAFIIGPGAGPYRTVGRNCELMANAKFGASTALKSHVAYVNPADGSCILDSNLRTDEFALMGNFLVSEGVPGKVLEVCASKRTGPENFTDCMRNALAKETKNGSRVISMGGCFLIEKGAAKLHVMPDFPSTPFKSMEDLDNWLQYYEMQAPLVCLSVFHSIDPGLELRMEHTHCFSTHGQGGHYHYDVTPNEVEYRGYFVAAEKLYRIDRPVHS